MGEVTESESYDSKTNKCDKKIYNFRLPKGLILDIIRQILNNKKAVMEIGSAKFCTMVPPRECSGNGYPD